MATYLHRLGNASVETEAYSLLHSLKITTKQVGSSSTGKGKVALEQATKPQRVSRGKAPLSNLGTRWGWVVNSIPQLLYP
jgi:hypothetical protein